MINANDYLRKSDSDTLNAAIADEGEHKGGELCYTHVMHNDWSRRDATIHHL